MPIIDGFASIDVCIPVHEPRAGRFKIFFIYFQTGVKYSWLISRNGRLSLPRLCYSNWRPGVCSVMHASERWFRDWSKMVLRRGWRSLAYLRSTSRVGFNFRAVVQLFSIILRITGVVREIGKYVCLTAIYVSLDLSWLSRVFRCWTINFYIFFYNNY